MAITDYQRELCRLVARNRIAIGESYVAGGVALNAVLGASRVSRDIDMFHDTREALAATWAADRVLLAEHGYELEVLRERPTFVEAVVKRDGEGVVVEWVCDSAFRFFPLVEHPDFGLTLHPFDLVTNKLLALVGRVEVRDWIDIIASSERLQHLGYLAWAACGKDAGYNPAMILAEGRRSARYTAADVAQLAFAGPAPDAAELSTRWVEMLSTAAAIVDVLPPEQVGRVVLDGRGEPYRGGPDELAAALAAGAIAFHSGTIRGALPQLVGPSVQR